MTTKLSAEIPLDIRRAVEGGLKGWHRLRRRRRLLRPIPMRRRSRVQPYRHKMPMLRKALLPQLVPAHVFPNAVVWSSSLYQLASISGPALAGMLIAIYGGASVVYGMNAALIRSIGLSAASRRV